MARQRVNRPNSDKRGERVRGFDAEAYYNALAQIVRAQKISWRQVARETGITPSTLTRMAQGRRPDAASLAVLSAWAGLNPADFVGNPRYVAESGKHDSTRDSLHAISGVLRSDPNLPPGAARALEDIIHVAYDELKRTPA